MQTLQLFSLEPQKWHTSWQKNVLKVWDFIYRQEKWEYNSPLISLSGTIFIYFFLPRKGMLFGSWIGKAQLKDIVDKRENEIITGIKAQKWSDKDKWMDLFTAEVFGDYITTAN